MSNFEFIEEILHDAHTLGIAPEVFEISRRLQSSGVEVSLAYDIAFRSVVSEKDLVNN